jgi:PAS domain S-box-containing protein
LLSAELWLLISVIPQFNQNGSVKQCWSIFEDITERKHWEQKLLDSEAQFKDLFDKAPVPVLIFETGGRLIDGNQASCALYGFDKNYIAESEYNIYLETEKLKSLDINIDDVFIESQTRNWYEVNFVPQIGISEIDKFMNIKMYPTKNLAGEISKIICFLEDVSYQKKYLFGKKSC